MRLRTKNRTAQRLLRSAAKLLALSFTLLLLALTSADALGQEIWQYAPYRIRVWVAMEPDLELTPALRDEIHRTLEERAWSVAGAVWSLEVQPMPPEIEAHALAGVDLIDTDLMLQTDPAAMESLQKIIVLRVSRHERGWSVQAREMDCVTRSWSPLAERVVPQRSLLGEAAFDALQQAFRPLAFIDKGKASEYKARLRAGGLALESPRLTDNSPGRLGAGAVLRPVIRRNDRKGRLMPVGGLEEIPWSYLIIKSNTRGRLECDLQTGVRSALAGRSSRRTLKLALGVSPSAEPTRLYLQSKSKTPRPLAGYDVFEKPSADESNMVFIGRSDWRGLVDVPPGEKTVRLLYVKHGNQVLARLPLAPGLHDSLYANVSDDDTRLEAEGFVKGLQSAAVDLVAQQQVLALRIRKAIAAKDLASAQKLADEFRSLPTKEDLQRRLDQQEKEQLAATQDVYTRKKIDELFGETRKNMSKLLVGNLSDQLMQEMAAARRGG